MGLNIVNYLVFLIILLHCTLYLRNEFEFENLKEFKATIFSALEEFTTEIISSTCTVQLQK